MLDRDPASRFGRVGSSSFGGADEGFEDLKKQQWFQGIDWEALDNKVVQPPFVPDVRTFSMHYFTSLTGRHYRARRRTLMLLTSWKSCF